MLLLCLTVQKEELRVGIPVMARVGGYSCIFLCSQSAVSRYSAVTAPNPGILKNPRCSMAVPLGCEVAVRAGRGRAVFCCGVSLHSEPVDKVAAVREFRVLHTALHSSPAYRDAVSGAPCSAPGGNFGCPLPLGRTPHRGLAG